MHKQSSSSKAKALTAVNKRSSQQLLHDIVIFVLGHYDLLPAGVRYRQFLRILPWVVLEGHCYFAGKAEVDARWPTAKLEESNEYLRCGFVDESSEPAADVIDVVALENYVVEDQLSR